MSSPLLDWSAQQGRVLTSEGEANDLYTKERGFGFQQNELPHYLKVRGEVRETFNSWRDELKEKQQQQQLQKPQQSLVGCWSRPLFASRWDNTTNKTEDCYNLQTSTLFIDLRLPVGRREYFRAAMLGEGRRRIRGLKDLTDFELRLFARVHVFSGFTLLNPNPRSSTSTTALLKTDDEPMELYTRHHQIDWNFIGAMRPRPNKWFAQFKPGSRDVWRESSYAKTREDESFYFERWERIPGGSLNEGQQRQEEGKEVDKGGGDDDVVISLRTLNPRDRDAIILITGNHFNYIIDRRDRKERTSSSNKTNSQDEEKELVAGVGSLQELVDKSLSVGRRDVAEHYLSIDGGHGSVHSIQSEMNGGSGVAANRKFLIQDSIRPWNEGQNLVSILRDSYDAPQIYAPTRVSQRGGNTGNAAGGGGVVVVTFGGIIEFEVFESNVSFERMKGIFEDEGGGGQEIQGRSKL
jgi:hypothetical protein